MRAIGDTLTSDFHSFPSQVVNFHPQSGRPRPTTASLQSDVKDLEVWAAQAAAGELTPKGRLAFRMHTARLKGQVEVQQRRQRKEMERMKQKLAQKEAEEQANDACGG